MWLSETGHAEARKGYLHFCTCAADAVVVVCGADGMTVVVTETGSRRDERAVRAVGPPLTAAPLTVMVNEHTASASEIFAGALHDNCRALLVGTRRVLYSAMSFPSAAMHGDEHRSTTGCDVVRACYPFLSLAAAARTGFPQVHHTTKSPVLKLQPFMRVPFFLLGCATVAVKCSSVLSGPSQSLKGRMFG